MSYKKKLIEVSLPLDVINAEAAREKSIRHGHPSTLHLWWARRPLAAARAVIWSSLVDDPSSLPEQFPTEEEQHIERERLFRILEKLVKWENSNDAAVLADAKAEIMKSTNGNPPALLDPFAGGGAISLEAQRLGLEAHASDLNPVAVMINKAMIEIPPKFANLPPVNPDSHAKFNCDWKGVAGLAEDVRYYGELMKRRAFERIGHLYPKIDGHTVIAWIWARTVKCPNPACGCEMPLASSFELSKKAGREAYLQPIVEGKTIRYEVRRGKGAPTPPKTSRGAKFKCICCGESTTPEYIKAEAMEGRLGAVLMAIVAEGKNGRHYFSPTDEHINAANVDKPDEYPTQQLPYDPRNIWCPAYGLDTFDKLFTNRQLVALTTFSGLVAEAQAEVAKDGGTAEYAAAVGVYLAFGISRLASANNTLCRWTVNKTQVIPIFSRQAIQMVWDYAENNVFNDAAGDIGVALNNVAKVVERFPTEKVAGIVCQHDAQSDNGLRNIMVSTDPPYYDNISYADVSDFFYVWLRKTLKNSYPDLFHTTLTPKAEELVASPYRFEGGRNEARAFFENGMLAAFKQIYVYAREDVPVTVYYAYKQSEDDSDTETASTGWETMLTAIIQSGFAVTGTWPMRTELANRMISKDTNALASSIVLVCRKRPADAEGCSRRDFLNALKRELRPALANLQASNIAPVDLAQSAIGPGMAVYSRYSAVLDADGNVLTVRGALQLINKELDAFFNEQEGDLDSDSRFCVDLYTQFGFENAQFGDAEVLAKAKNISIEKLKNQGILISEKSVVRLLRRDEISDIIGNNEPTWLLALRLTQAMAKGGVQGAANIVATVFGGAETAKALVYRLFTIAERKGRSQEAVAYNDLVSEWADIQKAAAKIRQMKPEQLSIGG